MTEIPTAEEVDELVHRVLKEFAKAVTEEVERRTAYESSKIHRKEVVEIIDRAVDNTDKYFYEV